LIALSATAQDTARGSIVGQSGLGPASSLSDLLLPPSNDGQPFLCKPCLRYSGDFDVNNPKANALTDERDLLVRKSVVYVPFTVPKGKIWTITGAFGVVLSNVNMIDPAQADWSFSKGVSDGHAGTPIEFGTSPATLTVLACNETHGFICASVLVKGLNVTLKTGRYWMTVVPYCTNPNDSNCQGARYFLADVEDNPPLNHYGPKNVPDASYASSKQFRFYYTPTWGSSGACGGFGCDMFSVGLLGTSKMDN
jgi:hypothetical protein